jgi:hypothetical protein
MNQDEFTDETSEWRLVSVESLNECAPQQYPRFHELGLELSD